MPWSTEIFLLNIAFLIKVFVILDSVTMSLFFLSYMNLTVLFLSYLASSCKCSFKWLMCLQHRVFCFFFCKAWVASMFFLSYYSYVCLFSLNICYSSSYCPNFVPFVNYLNVSSKICSFYFFKINRSSKLSS